MSSPWQTQETQASAPTATQSQISESSIPAPAAGSPASTTDLSPLVSPVGGPTGNATAPVISTSTTDASTIAAAVLPGSSAPNPQIPRALNGSSNEPLRDPVQAKCVSSGGYVVPAPSFSYNVFPRVNSATRSTQQSPSTPALKLTPPMPAAALQPPVPGQHFGNRPSFSYNVFLHANPSSACGQLFRPSTATGQMPSQGVKLTPPTTAASLQPPVPGQHFRPNNPSTPGTFTQSVPRPVGQLSTSSNFSFGENAQPTVADAAGKSLNPKDGTSNVGALGAKVSSVESVCSQSVKTSSSMPASSFTDSTLSPIPNSSNMLTSSSPSFTPRPGMSAMSGTTGLPVASNSSAIQPTTADSSPSPLRAIVPSPAAPSSLAAVSMAHPQNFQQQIYSPYPSMPPMAPTPQAPWLHPPLGGGLPHAPFFPYAGVLPPLFTLPMRGTSVPSVPTPNVQPPGVSTAIHRDVSSSAESMSKFTADHEKEVNDLHKEGGTTMREEADAWTAHKMSGTIYYYNSITGESTYDRPSSFKGEPEKVADQPTPVT